MSGKPKVVVVVDPYSSGRYLVQELQQQQWLIVGIQSSLELADFWLAQYDASLFVKTVRHTSLTQTVNALAEFDVVSVMPGSEPGVLLAEDLQDQFGLPGNGAATKDWRRDKHPMQERIREMGLRAIHQVYSDSVDEILEWQACWGRWPIIVKPAMSGGADGVYWCHGPEDVQRAYADQCGRMNVNGVVNAQLLAQEFLDGKEYIIDCVSHEGRHVVSGIWEYAQKRDHVTKGISKDYAKLCDGRGETADLLVDYVFKVLTALDLKYGPSHTEVILVNGEPCLVETGARMHGLKGPKLIEYGTGIGTHELAVDVAVNGARLFNQLYATDGRYCVKKWVFETLLRSDKTGFLLEDLDRPEIRALPTVLDIFPSVSAGDELQITVDLATCPGVILQCHASLDACWVDMQKIREMEATSLYKVGCRPAPLPLEQVTPSQPQGCIAQVRQACWQWCSSKPPAHAKPPRTPRTPSLSVMSPVKTPRGVVSVMSPVKPPQRAAIAAFEIVELDPSTDIEQ